MKLSLAARALYDAISQLEVIDAHTHIPSEAQYLEFRYCGPNLFAGGYVFLDLESAGMDAQFKETLREGGHRAVNEWWPRIKPFWEHTRHTSYGRALRLTARDWFGIPEINDTTIHELAAKAQADNRPGLYNRVFEKCRTRLALTCAGQAAFPNDPRLRGLTTAAQPYVGPATLKSADIASWGEGGNPVRSLAGAVSALQNRLREDIRQGAVGIKIAVAEFKAPDERAAEAEFKAALASAAAVPVPHLRDFLADKMFDVAAETDVPIAVHTGYWGDFRQLDVKFMLDFAARRRDVRFDLFHLGIPMVRDAILIGKAMPNITLNLTWCPIISQALTRRALDEIIDMVPLNKIIMFGNDYRIAVQKAWGHLVMARECAAAALAARIEAGDFDRAEALRIARLWFHDNPVRVYKLPV